MIPGASPVASAPIAALPGSSASGAVTAVGGSTAAFVGATTARATLAATGGSTGAFVGAATAAAVGFIYPGTTNFVPNPTNGLLWPVSNTIITTSGTLYNGSAMFQCTIGPAAGSVGAFFFIQNQPVNTDQIWQETLIVQALGSVTSNVIGLIGSLSTWGLSADSTASITSGPGALVQQVGGLWKVNGLSTSTPTAITITRTYRRKENASTYFYIHDSSGGGVSVGDAALVINPTFQRLDSNNAFANFAGATTFAGALTVAGGSTAAFVGADTDAGAVAAAGGSTATFAASSTARAALTATGASAATFTGAATARTALSAAGGSVGAMVGTAINPAVLSAPGSSAAAFVGATTFAGVLTVTGGSSAAFIAVDPVLPHVAHRITGKGSGSPLSGRASGGRIYGKA